MGWEDWAGPYLLISTNLHLPSLYQPVIGEVEHTWRGWTTVVKTFKNASIPDHTHWAGWCSFAPSHTWNIMLHWVKLFTLILYQPWNKFYYFYYSWEWECLIIIICRIDRNDEMFTSVHKRWQDWRRCRQKQLSSFFDTWCFTAELTIACCCR